MDDPLLRVLSAVAARKRAPDEDRVDLTLVSYRHMDQSDASTIRELLTLMREVAGAGVTVTGGGHGCTRINLHIEGDDADRVWSIWDVMKNRQLMQRAFDAGFRVMFSRRPGSYVNLETQELHGETKDTGAILFCSYSHKDNDLQAELKTHFEPLRWEGLLRFWYDGDINPGAEFNPEIMKRLAEAKVVLLLVSSFFFASEYILTKELPLALDRHEKNEAAVVPVILRPVDWTFTKLGKLKALPQDGRPVTEWPDRHTAFRDVAKSVRLLLRKARAN